MTDAVTLAAWLSALEEARASGLLEVEADGRRARYRSDEDLRAAIADLRRQLEPATRVHTVLVSSSKGL